MTPHPCHGPGWTRIPGSTVERYVEALPYLARRATRFGGARRRREALYRSDFTGAHYHADFVDTVFASRPRDGAFAWTELDRRDDGLRGPVRTVELSWTSPTRGPGRVLLHEVTLL